MTNRVFAISTKKCYFVANFYIFNNNNPLPPDPDSNFSDPDVPPPNQFLPPPNQFLLPPNQFLLPPDPVSRFSEQFPLSNKQIAPSGQLTIL